MRFSLIAAVALCAFSCVVAGNVLAEDILEWAELPELPPPPRMAHQLGVAGPFAGISGDALIVAGGANFPSPVWQSTKIWHDDIYVLVRDSAGLISADESYRWITGQKLDRPIAYGASVSTSQGVVCIGGNDFERAYSDVFLLQWDPEKKETTTKTLPSLPDACANSSATLIGDTIYVAGGTSGLDLDTAQRSFWSLNLSRIDDAEDLEWKRLLPWPGPSRAYAIAVAQHNGTSDCVYAREDAKDDRFNDYFGSLQSIVTSSAQNDSGLFETNLRDERYLPFENSGVIGEWQLHLPADPSRKDPAQFDYDTISDVILSYALHRARRRRPTTQGCGGKCQDAD